MMSQQQPNAKPQKDAKEEGAQKKVTVISVSDAEQIKRAEKHVHIFDNEKTQQVLKMSYVFVCDGFRHVCELAIEPCVDAFLRLKVIYASTVNAETMLKAVKEKLEDLESQIPSQNNEANSEEKRSAQVTPSNLNKLLRELVTIHWAPLKEHMAQREKEKTNENNLPLTDFGEISDILVAGVLVAKKLKPKDDEEAERFYQMRVDSHNQDFQVMAEAQAIKKQLIMTLPQQKKEYDGYKIRILNAKEKIDKLLLNQPLKAPVNHGHFAAGNMAVKLNAQALSSHQQQIADQNPNNGLR